MIPPGYDPIENHRLVQAYLAAHPEMVLELSAGGDDAQLDMFDPLPVHHAQDLAFSEPAPSEAMEELIAIDYANDIDIDPADSMDEEEEDVYE